MPTAASIVNLVTPEISASEETISIVESTSVQNTAIPDMIASKKLESTPSHATDRVTYVPVTAPRDLPSKPNQHLSGESVNKGSYSDAFEFEIENFRLKISLPLLV